MASTNAYRQRKLSGVSRSAPPLSATSSLRMGFDTSTDRQTSPVSEASKENVTVTVRFRPLSPREIRGGDEVAWYADGENTARSENIPSLAYAYDRVFGPTTTTRHVYDVAAQHVVSSAMEGINGTIFAYGVTSSGKTHTMHGDQRSPGIIPLAVKDVFGIIQETPSREFLLRVSYLEIYNEVVNDLLNPAGQNLRIREDLQGTFVEGIKEEVVLSPAHALSLIAAGEEHRQVGSTNVNLLSSRSHTIFTLIIESSPCGESSEGEPVNFSHLNLIDLAGSESARVETTGIRRKEGSYINKSLLTLGTVISKLTDGRATHIPYRDSKLTRLVQSSLSGQGRVSLICTVTPSSSNSEETHNTLKFAHRAKRIEIQASQNKIVDEKSLIKKYQNEIRNLKEELEKLKRGIVTVKDIGDNDIVLLKQKLEDGHIKLQSRLEQEEEAKATLLARIQRLTKLILVSTNASQSSRLPQRPGLRRRHSFGEEELAYLPYKRRDMILDDENCDIYTPLQNYGDNTDDAPREEKKHKKNGILNWFKHRKRENGASILTSSDGDKSSGTKSLTTPSTPQAESAYAEHRNSNSLIVENVSTDDVVDLVHDIEHPSHSTSIEETSLTSTKTIDHVDLLKEQLKILSGDVLFHSSVLKRLADEAIESPKEQIVMEMQKVNDEIHIKTQQIAALEKQISDSMATTPIKTENSGLSPSYNEVVELLNQKTLELEVKTADNRVIQEQLQQKISECEELNEAVDILRLQLSQALEFTNSNLESDQILLQNLREDPHDLQQQHPLASEIDELKEKITELMEAKTHLEARNQKLSEESSYAKGLASAAGVELKALSEEVTKLMNQNERLTAEVASLRSSPQPPRRGGSISRNSKRDMGLRRHEPVVAKDVNVGYEHELSLEIELRAKEERELELQKKMEESKQREAFLESELANMWVLVAKLKRSHGGDINDSNPGE